MAAAPPPAPSAAIGADVDTVCEKHRTAFATAAASIDGLIEVLERAVAQLAEGTAFVDVVDALTAELERCEQSSRRNEEFRELHAAVTKFAKSVDRAFFGNLEAALTAEVLDPALVARLVADEFSRQGRVALAHLMAEEKGDQSSSEEIGEFVVLDQVLRALRARDAGPCLQWHEAHRNRGGSGMVELGFVLHRLRFVQTLESAGPATSRVEAQRRAVLHARQYFQPYYATHGDEVRRLLASVLFGAGGPERPSPYADLFSASLWREAERLFEREYCAAMGLPPAGPLSLCLQAGSAALPQMLSFVEFMEHKNQRVNLAQSLPVEVKLPSHLQFHSAFVCPVTKEQLGPNQPVVLLRCGHAISREAMTRMAAVSYSRRVKCPTCPCEHGPDECLELKF